MNRQDYLDEGFRQLNDASFYRELPTDPTQSLETAIIKKLVVLKKSGKITKEVLNAIKPSHSKPGRFYLLPKIHKINNPGRPIVSGIGTVTERISSLVDTLIKDIPPTFPSFVKDTSHFLQKIAPLDIPDNAFLVTLDVASLYTNIPHRDGIAAVIEAYEHAHHTLDIEGDVLSILMTRFGEQSL